MLDYSDEPACLGCSDVRIYGYEDIAYVLLF